MDEDGHAIYAETTHYRYRDLAAPVTLTQYRYETCQVTDQAQPDN